MKKILLSVSLFSLLACSGIYAKRENGSELLKRFDVEPTSCEYLYKITSKATVYNIEDAYIYLENDIAGQQKGANSYFISEQSKKDNNAIIGPKSTYLFTAKVYNCK